MDIYYNYIPVDIVIYLSMGIYSYTLIDIDGYINNALLCLN